MSISLSRLGAQQSYRAEALCTDVSFTEQTWCMAKLQSLSTLYWCIFHWVDLVHGKVRELKYSVLMSFLHITVRLHKLDFEPLQSCRAKAPKCRLYCHLKVEISCKDWSDLLPYENPYLTPSSEMMDFIFTKVFVLFRQLWGI